jgi:ribosomal protein S24E
MTNLKIIKETENPLFNRKEVQVEINSDVTPSHGEVEELVSKKLSVDKENIKIKKIHGRFGSRDFLITINVYKSKEDKDKTEPKVKVKKS